jgi:hypothetical protein
MKRLGPLHFASILIWICATFSSLESRAGDHAHFFVTPDALIITSLPDQNGVPQKIRIRGQGKLIELSHPDGHTYQRMEGIEFRGLMNYNFHAVWDARSKKYRPLWTQQTDAIEWGRTATQICEDPNFFEQLIQDARRIQAVAQGDEQPQSQLTQEAWRRLLDESCDPPRISQAQRQRLERVLTEILSSYSRNSRPDRLLQCYHRRGLPEVAEDTAGILASTFNPAPGSRTRAKISCDLNSDQLSGRTKHGQTEQIQLNLSRIANDGQMTRTLLHEFSHVARPFIPPNVDLPTESDNQDTREILQRQRAGLVQRNQRLQADHHRVIELGEECCASGSNCERFEALSRAHKEELEANRRLDLSTPWAHVDLLSLSRQLGERGHEANRITLELNRKIQERLSSLRSRGCLQVTSPQHSECLEAALRELNINQYGENPQTRELVRNVALRLICLNPKDTVSGARRTTDEFAGLLRVIQAAEASPSQAGAQASCNTEYLDDRTVEHARRTHPGLFREASRELRERQIMRGGSRDPNRDEDRMLLGRSATPAPTPAPGSTAGAVVAAATSLPDLSPSQWWRDSSSPSSLNRQRAANRYRREIDDGRTSARIPNPLGDYRPSDVRVGLSPSARSQENVRIGKMQDLIVGRASGLTSADPEAVIVDPRRRNSPDDPDATPAPGAATPVAPILAEGSLPVPRGRSLAAAATARGLGGIGRTPNPSEGDQNEEPPPAIDDAWPRARLVDTLVSEYRFVEPFLRDRSFLRRLNEERIGVEDRNGQRHGHRQPATWYTFDENLKRLKRSAGPRATPRS